NVAAAACRIRHQIVQAQLLATADQCFRTRRTQWRMRAVAQVQRATKPVKTSVAAHQCRRGRLAKYRLCGDSALQQCNLDTADAAAITHGVDVADAGFECLRSYRNKAV